MVEGPGCKLKGIKIKAKLLKQTVKDVSGNSVEKVQDLTLVAIINMIQLSAIVVELTLRAGSLDLTQDLSTSGQTGEGVGGATPPVPPLKINSVLCKMNFNAY